LRHRRSASVQLRELPYGNSRGITASFRSAVAAAGKRWIGDPVDHQTGVSGTAGFAEDPQTDLGLEEEEEE
jgi:hypothetical protein